MAATPNPFATVARRVEESAQARARAILALGDIVGSDASLAAELIEALNAVAAPAGESTTSRARPGRPSAVFEQVKCFFEAKGNAWAQVEAIASGTGLRGDAIRQSLYKSAADLVEKRPVEGHGRNKEFRLRRT